MSDNVAIRFEETARYEGAPIIAPYRLSSIEHFFPVTSAAVRPAPSLMDRSDEVRGHLSPTAQIVESFAPTGTVNVRGYGPPAVVLLHAAGFNMTVQAGEGVNAEHELAITGTPTGGTFTITVFTETTGDLPYNATAAQVQRALRKLPSVGNDGVVCTGTALPTGPITIAWQGRHAAQTVAVGTTTDSLTGGTAPTSAITSTVTGSTGGVLTPAGTGVPVGAYLWTSAKRTGNQAKTFDIRASYEGNSVFKQGQGFGVSQLSLDAMATMQATLLGLVHQEIDDPALSPSYLTSEVAPWLSRDLVVTWRDGSGNVSDLSASIANPIVAMRDYGRRSAFPGTMRYDQGYTTVTGSVNTDALDVDDEESLLLADRFAASAHWRSQSTVAATGAPYEMWLEMPACQIVGGTGADDMTARRNHSGAYEFMAAYDETAGYDAKFSVVCGLAAIEAYA